MSALSQRKQLVIEAYSTRYEHHIVSRGPSNTLALIRRYTPLLIILFIHIRRSDGNASLNPNAAIESGESHPVAEGMCQHARIDIASSYEYKCGEETEKRCVGELEEGAEYGHEEWDLWVCYAELVEVVEVGDAEVKRGEKDDLLSCKLSQDVEGDDEGAPDELFTDGALSKLTWDEIAKDDTHDYKGPVSNPATQSFAHTI
jgi:hypothetical protein